MIRSKILNLRSVDWAQRISRRELRERIERDHQTGDDQWKTTLWQRQGGPHPHRSYLITSEGGSIYAIFFGQV